MSRRIPTSRRPTMESLEARCNPAALDPLAGLLVEPAPADAPAVGPGETFTYALDPRTSGSGGDFDTDGSADIITGSLSQIGGAGDDILIAGTTVYDSDSASSSGPYTSVTGRITAIDFDELESIIDDLTRDVASQSESRSSGSVDLNGDGIDEVIVGADSGMDGDKLASGYVKVKKLTSGG